MIALLFLLFVICIVAAFLMGVRYGADVAYKDAAKKLDQFMAEVSNR